MTDHDNGWSEYQRLVLAELERHNDELEKLNAKYNEIRQEDLPALKADLIREINTVKVEVGMLKVRAGVWGLLAGIIPVLILVFIKLLT